MDATVGGSLATSYLSVAAADAMAAADLGNAARRWLDAAVTVADRERALVRATREVDAYLRSSGTRWVTTQALLYPRSVDTLASLAVASASVASPTVITTVLPHGLASGDSVTLAGHAGSTPALDGTYTATVTGEATFTIPVAVTIAGSGGTVASTRRLAYLPSAIRQATYAQAKFLLDGGADSLDRAERRSSRKLDSVSENSMSYSMADTETPYLTAEARAHLGAMQGSRRATITSVKLATDYYDPLNTEVLA